MLTEIQKTEIKNQLDIYVEHKGSQSKAAATLRNVSAATLSQIRNNNWENIDDRMWRNIASQIGIKSWAPVATSFYQLFTELLEDARLNSFMYAITAEAGSGKTFAARIYAATHKNVCHIVCCESWNVQQFMSEILRSLGCEQLINNNNNSTMLTEVVKQIKMLDCPLLEIDEADKLRNNVLYSLITLYNQLEDCCGIILCATSHLESRIMRGVGLNHMGYNELFSRIGRKFINLPVCGKQDIIAICRENGIDDGDKQAEVYNDSQGDLRRVKRLIHAFKNEAEQEQ